MAEHEINVYIEDVVTSSPGEVWFKSIAGKILDFLDIAAPAELGLVITGNETISRLNMTYRDNAEATDVLAFPMSPQHEQEDVSIFIDPPDGIQHLGEIIISYPQAFKQAEEQGHEGERELIILLIHGVLHLLGYDHELFEEGQVMRAKEAEIVKKLCI